jgi:hypothetical protein
MAREGGPSIFSRHMSRMRASHASISSGVGTCGYQSRARSFQSGLLFGEAVQQPVLVLEDPRLQVTGHTNLKCTPGLVGHDVDEELFGHRLLPNWMARLRGP